MTKTDFVVFEGADEVIITIEGKPECNMLREWFAKGTGRNLDNYDRKEVSDNCVVILSKLVVDN